MTLREILYKLVTICPVDHIHTFKPATCKLVEKHYDDAISAIQKLLPKKKKHMDNAFKFLYGGFKEWYKHIGYNQATDDMKERLK